MHHEGAMEPASDSDVDQTGLERLINALGQDGLNEFDHAQLVSLKRDNDLSQDDIDNDSGSDSGHSSNENEDNADDDDEGIPLDQVSTVDDDVVPHRQTQIDNTLALQRIRRAIQLDPSFPWTETLTISYPESISVDVHDDLNRELAFYKQALHGANTARDLAQRHALPFSRPADYFAEMSKSDVHMERVHQRLLDQRAAIDKSEERRKERAAKKFGKQLQIEKLKEREKNKKEFADRIKLLKRKRKDMLGNPKANDGEDFDVAVEDAISRPSKRTKTDPSATKKMPRFARNKKFGFSGPVGRRAKQNTKASTDDFYGLSGTRGKGTFGSKASKTKPKSKQKTAPKRPGKGRRIAARNKSKS